MPLPEAVTVAERGYRDHPYWSRYQDFFPGGLRVDPDSAPAERYWPWRASTVHIDCLPRSNAPAMVLALHGIGSYGRMLAPFGRLPALADLEFCAPDLPGFGLTEAAPTAVAYSAWRECIIDLLTESCRAQQRPILLFGVGTGGRLAYDVAGRLGRMSGEFGPRVVGVIATSLAGGWQASSRPRRLVLSAAARVLSAPLRRIPAPLRWFVDVPAMVNHSQFARLMCADPFGGGARVPYGLVRGCAGWVPSVRPEVFRDPPLLLTSPGRDRWTPPPLSRCFLDRVGGTTRFTLLSGAGHLPIEESGLADLDRAVRDFRAEIDL